MLVAQMIILSLSLSKTGENASLRREFHRVETPINEQLSPPILASRSILIANLPIDSFGQSREFYYLFSYLFRCRVDEPHVDVLHLPDTCNKEKKLYIGRKLAETQCKKKMLHELPRYVCVAHTYRLQHTYAILYVDEMPMHITVGTKDRKHGSRARLKRQIVMPFFGADGAVSRQFFSSSVNIKTTLLLFIQFRARGHFFIEGVGKKEPLS